MSLGLFSLSLLLTLLPACTAVVERPVPVQTTQTTETTTVQRPRVTETTTTRNY